MRVLLLCALLVAAPCAQARHHHHRANAAPVTSFWSGSSDLVSVARSQLGNGAIYGRATLWCARFVNTILMRTGHHGTGSDLAKSFLSFPKTDMHVGAIAVMGRRGGGHVGIVSGVDGSGNPIIISGNNARRVREGAVSRGRVLRFVEAE